MGISRLALVEPKFTPWTPLPTDRTEDVYRDVDFGLRHPDQVKSTAYAEHGNPLLGHGFLAHEVEDMIGASRQKVAHGLDRCGLRGVNDVSRAESSGCLEPVRLDVDH